MSELLHIAIVSSGRSQNVPAMSYALENVAHTWYVGKGEGEIYRNAGAKNVVEAGGLIQSRNRALEDAFAERMFSVQISDDLKSIEWNSTIGKAPTNLTIERALSYLHEAALKSEATLIGIAPTANAFFAKKPLLDNGFVIGDAFLCKPTHLRFDEKLRLKEDYDFSLQHIANAGGTLRVHKVLWHFAHYSNKGGAVSYRSDGLEQETVMYLLRKWSGALRPNPKRKNELLFDRKAVQALWATNRSREVLA